MIPSAAKLPALRSLSFFPILSLQGAFDVLYSGLPGFLPLKREQKGRINSSYSFFFSLSRPIYLM